MELGSWRTNGTDTDDDQIEIQIESKGSGEIAGEREKSAEDWRAGRPRAHCD